MKTGFQTTATVADNSGKFRTSIILATDLYGDWSEQEKAEHIKRQQLPTRAIDLTPEQYLELEANPWKRFGYVEKSGDLVDFVPCDWVKGI